MLEWLKQVSVCENTSMAANNKELDMMRPGYKNSSSIYSLQP